MLIRLAIFVALVAVLLFLSNKYYFSGGWCHSTSRIDGKVVIVTGANTGIGKETALDLVRRGGKVYLACRSVEKCSAAASDLKKLTKTDDSKVLVMNLDLGSMKSIRKFAADFKQREEKLDILINNAGIMAIADRQTTEDGFEMTLGVNHLGHFLLTNLLLDQLFAAQTSRVVTVSSKAHRRFSFDLDDLQLEKEGAYTYKGYKSYSQSKSANILFSQELGRRLEGYGVTTYSLHPGTIDTQLVENIFLFKAIPYLREIAMGLYRPFIKNVEEGKQTTICCAVDEDLAEDTGKYYSDCAEMEPEDYAKSEDNARRLWAMSLELVKLERDETHPLLR